MNLLLRYVATLSLLAFAFSLEFNLNSPPSRESPLGKYEQLSHDSLLWGPYRSGNYLGIRPRLPNSLMSGLMWFNVDTHAAIQKAKHFFEQGDNVGRANWVQFDPRYGGREVISDDDCHINITIDFVKSENGRNWAVKVAAVPHEGFEDVKTSFIWYSGLEGDRIDPESEEVLPMGFFKLDNPKKKAGYQETVTMSGFSEDLGMFEVLVSKGTGKHPDAKVLLPEVDPKLTHHLSLRVPNESVWRAKEIFMTLLQDSVKDFVAQFGDTGDMVPACLSYCVRNLQNYEGNLHFVQKMFEGACSFEVLFNEANSPPSEKLTLENLDLRISQVLHHVDANFAKHFQLAGFDDDEKEFGKEILSGLLGGLSYFHGDHLVDRTTVIDDDVPFEENEGGTQLPKLDGKLEGPFELFTLVPSRPFFPRGFYWDEGFHLLPLLKYDTDLALEIFKSWFDLIDDEGWIAREQILGPELRSRVPPLFQVQSPAILNPPTLMLAFTYLLDRPNADEPVDVDVDHENFGRENLGQIVINNPELLANYTREIYPKLKLHYHRFRSTQLGQVEEFERGTNSEAYRWRGRTVTHCLASGLDDYPRALPIDVAELNVDLLCWMGVMTRSIKMIAELLDLKEDVKLYTAIEENVSANIEALHWSEEHKVYCDLTVDEEDENTHACFRGYISLFPFLTKFIPAQSVDKLEHMVDFLADPEEMWSEYGIRSMSKADELYRTGENYWRSPIWININFLVLDNLQHYYEVSGPFASSELKAKIRTTYTQLRKNIISNVKLQWEKTGFVWEQYDDETGQAKGAKNFLGWSSAVLLMMEMPETLK